MTHEELINKIVDAMSISHAVDDEGEMPILYDIIDAQPNKTYNIIRAAAEAALFVIEINGLPVEFEENMED